MSVTRENLLNRADAIKQILASSISVDNTPVPLPSSPAVVVRNGCMVMLFCALEGFIRERSLECALAIDQAVVPFIHLPEQLKVLSMISTFEGLLNQSRGWPVADRLSKFEQATIDVASGPLGTVYKFTEYSFARDKSNVTTDDIGKIAKAFGVTDYWAASKVVCQKAGVSITGSLDEGFRQLAKERHKAAHVAAHNVPHSTLAGALPMALAIAISFDVLITQAIRNLNRSNIAAATQPVAATGAAVSFITVKPHKGKWAVFLPNVSRAHKIYPTSEAANAGAVNYGRSHGHSVVVTDATGRIADWTTFV